MRRTLWLVLGVAVVGGCSDKLPATATVAATDDLRFEPTEASVRAGGSVTWEFGAIAHSVVFTTGGSPSDIADPVQNQSVSRSFPAPGLYYYECGVHPEMSGRIRVAESTDDPY